MILGCVHNKAVMEKYYESIVLKLVSTLVKRTKAYQLAYLSAHFGENFE